MSRARVGLGIGASLGLGAAGVVLLSMAAAGAGPTDYPVVIGGSATPVAPVTASPSPGQALIFINSGAAPYVLTRTATPFALATTIAPSSSSTPFTVPTAEGSYPYTAQLRQPTGLLGQAGNAGPTLQAQVLVVKPSASASVISAPTAPATTAAAAVTTAPARTPSPVRRSSAPRRGSSPKASASASASGVAIAPGGLLPQPAQPPLFSDGAAVPLPVLPTGIETVPATVSAPPTAAAGQEPVAPIASVAPPSPLAVGPILADAPRMGPRRSRGLPIALAIALLLGIGGGVARTLARTGQVSRPRLSRPHPRR